MYANILLNYSTNIYYYVHYICTANILDASQSHRNILYHFLGVLHYIYRLLV